MSTAKIRTGERSTSTHTSQGGKKKRAPSGPRCCHDNTRKPVAMASRGHAQEQHPPATFNKS